MNKEPDNGQDNKQRHDGPMRRADKMTLAILGIAVILIGIFALTIDRVFPVPREVIDDEPVHPRLSSLPFGTNPGAPITIVEFGDYQCPNTKAQRPALQKILGDLGASVNYVHKDFPSGLHPQSRVAAQAAACVRRISSEKSPSFEDMLYSHQDALHREDLIAYATNLSIDTPTFARCMDDPEVVRDIQSDINTGVLEGVPGTPTLFINGKPFKGIQSYSKLKVILDSLIEIEHQRADQRGDGNRTGEDT